MDKIPYDVPGGFIAANPIREDSWLRKPEHNWFFLAYDYASNQTQAIPALASCTPEQMFHAFEALQRGMERVKRQCELASKPPTDGETP